jgi:fructose 1,6-bisphosphate aldolase/phosphatase
MTMAESITLSVIKADVGGLVGHSGMHEDLMAVADEHLDKAQVTGLLLDYHVTACGDDLELIMTHRQGDLYGVHGASAPAQALWGRAGPPGRRILR